MAAPAWVVDDLKTYLRKKHLVDRERSTLMKGLQHGHK